MPMSRPSVRPGLIKLATLVVVLACSAPAGAWAVEVPGAVLYSVRGDVRDRADGKPIAAATVSLEDPSGAKLATLASGRRGAFEFPAVRAGRYRIEVTAPGYEAASLPLALEARPAPVRVSMAREGALHEIGATVVRAVTEREASAVRTSSGDALAAPGSLRVSDALAALPGIGTSGDALAPGGDAYLSLRGLRPGESQTFLDGHPIGPLGVQTSGPDTDGTIAGFNYQDAPYFALRAVEVSFGAGASELASTDAIGGTVDLRTFDPTRSASFEAQQGVGSQGRAFTALRATGTDDKLGYALVHSVEGTYGAFPGASIAQTGLRGTDLTSQRLAELTYRVSGDYTLRNDLAKLTYALSPATKLAVSAYDATSWSDKTGEGDNDFNPYAYVLANAPVGASPACPRGVAVTTDGGPQCLTPSAYAAAASGPAGGGPGAWQALRNQDYDARLSASAGAGTLAFDAYTDAYAVLYHRDASAASGPLDAFLDRWSTQGLSLSDELTGRSNAIGFGLAWLRETLSGDATSADGSALVTDAPAARIDRNAFVRDVYTANSKLSFVFNAWLKSATGDPSIHLDPRLSVVYRPLANDVLRFTAGNSSEEPGLENGRVDLLPVGALNPNCGAIARANSNAPAAVEVGSGPSLNLGPEAASDLEVAYDHRFGGDSSLGLSVYETNLTDRIVTGEFAAGGLLPASAVAPLEARIAQFCGLSPAPGALEFTLDRAFNAATARVRGFELAGRARVSQRLALDYSYSLQSAVLNDLPTRVLETDPTLVNGSQAFGIPRYKATLGLELDTRGGLTARLTGHAAGPNNPQQLPGFAYADASLEAPASRRVTLALDVANVFDSHAQTYGVVGYGLPYPTNPYNATLASPFLQPFNERYGLQPTSLTLSARLHL
jgi:hypothetical protein